MVILSGELDEMPAESLMQMLVHQSPEVPVVCLDAARARAALDAASCRASRRALARRRGCRSRAAEARAAPARGYILQAVPDCRNSV